MVFESVEVRRPEPAVRRQPVVELRKWLRPDPVKPALCIDAGFHQPRVLEDAEVLGDAGLADLKAIHDLADRPLAVSEQIEDRQPSRLGQDLERG
jgi:hypothetical protein